MDLATALAIIVPAVVTPSVVALYSLLQQRAQRRQAERDELLATVDRATDLLVTAIDHFPGVMSDWTSGKLSREEAETEARRLLDPLRLMLNRLAIRVGDDRAIFVAYQAAGLAVSRYYYETRKALLDRRELSFNDHHALVLDLAQEPSKFFDAARAAVGHRLRVASAASDPALHSPPPMERDT